MDKKDYIKTLNVNGYKVDLGIDDYGQCYYIEYEKDGEKKETGLGTYNFSYMEEIYCLLDPIYNDLDLRHSLIEMGIDTIRTKSKDIKKIEWADSDEKLYKEYKNIFQKEYKN